MADVARLVISVSANTRTATAQLSALSRQVNSLGRNQTNLSRSVNGATASMSRQASVTRTTSRSITTFSASLNRASSSSSRFAKMAKAGVFATLAMQPVMQQGAAVLGGLASAFTLAAVAAGAFGLAVAGAFANSKKVDAAQKRLDQSFRKFSDSTAKFTEGPIITVLDAMGRGMQKLVPLVGAVAPVADKTAKAFAKWTDGKLEKWVSFISAKGVPILDNFLQTFRNLGTTFGQLVIQFQPLGKVITDFLKTQSGSMANWAKNGGFTQWLASIKGNAPAVIEFFKSLKDALINVNAAMKILGPLALGLTTILLKVVAALPPEVLATMIGLWLTLGTAMKVAAYAAKFISAALLLLGKAVRAVIIVWRLLSLAFMLSPVGFVITAILALVATFVILWNKCAAFRNFWKMIWNAIKSAFSVVVNFIINYLRVWWRVITTIFNAIKNAVVSAWNATWNFVRTSASSAISRVRALVSGMWNALRTMFNGIRNTLSSIWNTLWNGIKSVASGAWKAVQRGFSAFSGGLRSAFSTLVEAVKKVWSGLKSAVAAPVRFFVNTVYNDGLRSAWNKTAGKIPGVPDLPKASVGFSSGGYTGNGGKYEPKGIVHGGEFVIKKSSARKIPNSVLAHMNSTGRIPGYASGGSVGTGAGSFDPNRNKGKKKSTGVRVHGIPGKTTKAKVGIGDLWDPLWKIVRRGAGAAVNKSLGWVRGLANGMGNKFPKGGEWSKMIPKVVNSGIDKMVEFIKGKEQDPPMMGGYSAAAGWKDGDGRRVSYNGAQMNVRTMRMLKNAEKLFGAAFRVTQGSYSNSVGASAGTHSGGGVLDIAQTSDKAVGALRASGFAAWARTRKEGFSPHIHAVAVGDKTLSGAAKRQVDSFFAGKNGLANNGPDTYKGGMAGGSGKWGGIASAVLQELGQFSPTNLSNVLKAIKKESGGNPNAVNNWDINAKNGVASRGLLQVIPPTFNAYAGKYKKRGITDPYANIYAAVRYAKSRYGSGWSARMARPGGYATGTNNARKGWNWVGENGPELMHFGGGEKVMNNKDSMAASGVTIVVNVQGNLLSTKRDIEDAVVQGYNDARRKGRIR